MSKVFSYVRFSSQKQADGDSFDRQVKAAREFCDEYGLELAGPREYLFFDAGRSAYKGKHLDDTGELARFLAYVEDGTIPEGSYLVVESLDRLSRERVRDALPRFLDLLAKGINVYTSTDKRLYTHDYNDIDLIVSILVMSRAHEESSSKGTRVSSAWRNKQKEARDSGKPLGKLRPLWLDLTAEGYVPNPERVAVVKRMFQLTTEGYGTRVIAATLNQEGIPAFTAGNKKVSGVWGFSSIRHILESRAVLGEYQPHIFVEVVEEGKKKRKRIPDGDPITNYFPAIITEDDFYRAQAARTSRLTGRVTKTTENFNVYAGIIRCYKCGAAMHIQGHRGRKYFKCFNSQRGLCDAGLISAPRAEDVFKEILAKVDSLSLVQDSSGKLAKELQAVDGRIATLKQRLQDTEELHAEAPSRTSAKLLSQLETDLDQLGADRQALAEQMAADKVISKEDFFQKLDLVSYEGRAAANNLLKRLGIHVFAEKLARTNESYRVMSKNIHPEAATEDGAYPVDALTAGLKYSLFSVHHNGKAISIHASSNAILETQVMQGEMTLEEAEALAMDFSSIPPDVREKFRTLYIKP